ASSPSSSSGRPHSECFAVQALQQVVGGEFDLLVPPFGRPVETGDDAHPVQPLEIAVDECVPGLGVIAGTVGEPEMPAGVFLPGVRLQEGVLLLRARLDLAPVAVEYVLPGVDEMPCPRDTVRVHRVRSHRSILPGYRANTPWPVTRFARGGVSRWNPFRPGWYVLPG